MVELNPFKENVWQNSFTWLGKTTRTGSFIGLLQETDKGFVAAAVSCRRPGNAVAPHSPSDPAEATTHGKGQLAGPTGDRFVPRRQHEGGEKKVRCGRRRSWPPPRDLQALRRRGARHRLLDEAGPLLRRRGAQVPASNRRAQGEQAAVQADPSGGAGGPRRWCRRTPAAVQADPGGGASGSRPSRPCSLAPRRIRPPWGARFVDSAALRLEWEAGRPCFLAAGARAGGAASRAAAALPACPVSPAAAPQPASGWPWSRE
jgi:hypothetical protein